MSSEEPDLIYRYLIQEVMDLVIERGGYVRLSEIEENLAKRSDGFFDRYKTGDRDLKGDLSRMVGEGRLISDLRDGEGFVLPFYGSSGILAKNNLVVDRTTFKTDGYMDNLKN